jgi:hypothetical protein
MLVILPIKEIQILLVKYQIGGNYWSARAAVTPAPLQYEQTSTGKAGRYAGESNLTKVSINNKSPNFQLNTLSYLTINSLNKISFASVKKLTQE